MSLVVLMFHHVTPQKDVLSVTPEILEKLIVRFKQKGFHFISYREFYDYLNKKITLPKKSLMLTFDDGYYDNYQYGYEVLKKHNIPAVIFLITSLIPGEKKRNLPFKSHHELNKHPDKNYFLSLEEIKEMHSSGLIEFDSHTHTHQNCVNLSKEELEFQMCESKNFIKSLINRDFYGFCWPRGRFDDNALEAVKRCGYDFAFSTIEGPFSFKHDKFIIRRIDASSFRGDEKVYFKRLNKKVNIYSSFYGNIYSDLRLKLQKLKKRFKALKR